jgi:hypothetical protein
MDTHQLDLRLHINHIETMVGCIAKSTDEQVTNQLPEFNQLVSNLRHCLSAFQDQWWMFDYRQNNLNDIGCRPQRDS